MVRKKIISDTEKSRSLSLCPPHSWWFSMSSLRSLVRTVSGWLLFPLSPFSLSLLWRGECTQDRLKLQQSIAVNLVLFQDKVLFLLLLHCCKCHCETGEVFFSFRSSRVAALHSVSSSILLLTYSCIQSHQTHMKEQNRIHRNSRHSSFTASHMWLLSSTFTVLCVNGALFPVKLGKCSECRNSRW